MYYVMWTPGRVADAFAAANADPNKNQNVIKSSYKSALFTETYCSNQEKTEVSNTPQANKIKVLHNHWSETIIDKPLCGRLGRYTVYQGIRK